MTKYVALLRGIGPGNPRMRNENLRAVCAALGFQHAATVISSGNVIFESASDDVEQLESRLEAAWPSQLGFKSTTIIRSRDHLEALVARSPFGALQHGPQSYLLVTFAKRSLPAKLDLPDGSPGDDYQILSATDLELFTVTDTTAERTPDVMTWLERSFGQQITSRTWLTVGRILKRMA